MPILKNTQAPGGDVDKMHEKKHLLLGESADADLNMKRSGEAARIGPPEWGIEEPQIDSPFLLGC